jgi:L-asparaginase II
VLGAAGDRIATVGDPDLVVYPRSALKPLQATAMVGLGLDVPDDELAVVCASHDGDRDHLAAVRRLLAHFGLDETDLQNTPGHPLGAAPRDHALRTGIAPSPLQQNCSGKHAGMLATCVVNGWPTDTYLDPDHPVQRGIVAAIEQLGIPVHHIGVDGCGAPTHAVSLSELAAAFAALATGGADAVRAMTAHPDLVGGPMRDVTLWMRAVPGLVAKEGAAAVMAFALADGRAGAFKIAGGDGGARRTVFVEALRLAGVDVAHRHAATADQVAVPVLGHGEPVGVLRPLEWVSCTS